MIVMKRKNKTALRQTMITSNMSWQWRPYGKHSLRNQMIKVISSPSMLISNFILFNCVVIIFSIFSFYTFSQFYIWQYCCSPPISSYLIVLWLFSLFSHSILFSQIYTWQNYCPPPISNYLIVLLFFYFLILQSFQRFIADNIIYCSPQISNYFCVVLYSFHRISQI